MNKELEALLESNKYVPLDETQKSTLSILMENTIRETEIGLQEGTISADIAGFTPFLLPILRKTFPALVANELVGVQPMSGPTGFIYTLTNRYVGNAVNGITGKPGTNQGGTGPYDYDKTNAATQILLIDAAAAGQVPAVGDGVTLDGNTYNSPAAAGDAVIVYVEPTAHGALASNTPAGQTVPNSIGGQAVGGQEANLYGVLVELPTNGSFLTAGKVVPGTVVKASFTGYAGYDKILPNYSGSYTTAEGEVLGTPGNEMNEMGLAVERVQVEARLRKLRANYTIEMYQDLKNMHGILADQELMNLLSWEIKADIDREIIDFVNSKAALKPDFYMSGGYGAVGTPANLNAGRWEIERYRALVIKLADESREIGRRNKRGGANKLLVSPKVLTALEAVGGFSTAPVDSSVNVQNSGIRPVAGRFDNKYSVIVDNYADQGEYATLIYKGSNQDAMGVFAPYTPVQIQKVVSPATGQPSLIAATRYGLGENPWGGDRYSTTFGIVFDSTVLA